MREECNPDGGYLVPEVIVENKKGLQAGIYRCLGRWLRSEYFHKKDTREFRLADAIRKLVMQKPK